jgi:hypothetical protein
MKEYGCPEEAYQCQFLNCNAVFHILTLAIYYHLCHKQHCRDERFKELTIVMYEQGIEKFIPW